MILHLLLLLGQNASSADQVLDRYAAAHKQLPKIEAVYSTKMANLPVVDCRILLDERNRVMFVVDYGKENYKLTISPKLVREIESTQKQYEDYDWPGRLAPPPSKLSTAVFLFPDWIYVDDLRKLVPPNTPFRLGEPTNVNGFPVDTLTTRYGNPQEGGDYLIRVDTAGTVVEMKRLTWGMQGRVEHRWVLKDFRRRSSFKDSEFDLPIPAGYTPYKLPGATLGIEVGNGFPMEGWSTSGSNRTSNLSQLSRDKGLLIALLSPDCEPSRASLASLKRLEATVPVATLSTTTSAGIAKYFDAGGKTLEILNVPATPLFVLVDKSGKIRKMWMGYDAERAGAFEREVTSAAAE